MSREWVFNAGGALQTGGGRSSQAVGAGHVCNARTNVGVSLGVVVAIAIGVMWLYYSDEGEQYSKGVE